LHAWIKTLRLPSSVTRAHLSTRRPYATVRTVVIGGGAPHALFEHNSSFFGRSPLYRYTTPSRFRGIGWREVPHPKPPRGAGRCCRVATPHPRAHRYPPRLRPLTPSTNKLLNVAASRDDNSNTHLGSLATFGTQVPRTSLTTAHSRHKLEAMLCQDEAVRVFAVRCDRTVTCQPHAA